MRATSPTTLARYVALAIAPVAVLLLGCPPSLITFTYEALPSSTGTGTGAAHVCTPGAAASCYDGPAGTEGVGICKAGTETCAADGSGWGPCVDEVLPQMGNCATGMDNVCDGVPTVCTGTTLWAKRFGDALDQQGSSIATDTMGNVLVAGFVGGSIDFGSPSGPLPSAGGDDIFVAKLGPSGTPVWIRLFGNASDQQANGIATDAMGNVLVTGTVAGSVTIGPTLLTSAGSDDIFLAKLDPTGTPLWSKLIGDEKDQQGASVATDTAGNVLLTGWVDGTVDFGGNVGTLTSAGLSDIFVAKFDPNGAALWAKRFGDASAQQGLSVATDTAGNVLITGWVRGSVDFGGGMLTGAGDGAGIFVAKFNPNGAPLWSKVFGTGSTGNVGRAIAADAAGNVFVTGWVIGSIDLGTGMLPSGGGFDVFVAKLGPNSGATVWAKRFGGAADQAGQSIAIDPSSNIVVGGYFSGAVDFGGNIGTLTSAGHDDIFIAKLDPNGAAIWAKRFGDAADQSGLGIATDPLSNVLITGYMGGTVDFGIPAPLASMGGEDIFVAKLSP